METTTSKPKKNRADCTVRALRDTTGIAYELAFSIAEEAGRSSGCRFSAKKLIAKAKERGFSFRKIRMGSRTLRKFIRQHPVGRFYVVKRGHAFAVTDGVPSESYQPQGCILLHAWQLEQVSA